MTSQSKLGTAFVIAFGIPFLGAGLLFAIKLLQATDQPLATRIGGAMFGSVFAIIGAGLIFGSLIGYSQLKAQTDRELANPGSPWLWRKDWAAGRVESQNKSKAMGWWVAAALVNMMSLPISLGAYSQLSRTQDPTYIVPAAFELIGLIMLLGAIRATIRFERFGKTYFEMNSLPYSPGGHVTGAIHVQIPSDVPHGIDLKLSCFRRISTGAGKGRSTNQITLWEDSKNIAATSLSRGPLDTIVPVDFVLPPDAFETDRDNPDDQVHWVLDVKADVPGVDYSDQFELPVHRTSQPALPAASSGFGNGVEDGIRSGHFTPTTTTSSEVTADVAEPAQHRVILNHSSDGLEFYFRAGRNASRGALVLALTAVCTAFLYALLHSDRQTPMFAIALVGVMVLVLVVASIHTVLVSTRLVVGNGMISWRRSVFGIGFSGQVQISDVDSILPVTSIQAGSGGSSLYSLRLRTKNGKTQTLVDDIESRQEARWIVSQIGKRSGLALNTQVEIRNSIYGPPPQPGVPGRNDFVSSTTRARATGNTSNLSPAIGAIFFLGWLAFIGFMVLRTAGHRNAGTRRGESSAAHSVRTERMSKATLEQVRAFSAQEQAEELLARSVRHDHTALQLLTQSSPRWVGNIHRTDPLEQVENQARYSSDLRVRRAEADVELAVDGWSKTPNSVSILMDRARSDPSYRALALYYLGILAGDGIDSERSHPFVLDYARNNSDPAVRQWATEGLRFVGTDQALDELFYIFTEDPSFSVRDRAGCNISDCGIFERKQRFRLVPRLIDLVSDPHLNPQMSNWCFLALREITGENLSGDAGAWRRWYAAKGPDKRAEFEALEWWQVRGDN